MPAGLTTTLLGFAAVATSFSDVVAGIFAGAAVVNEVAATVFTALSSAPIE